MPTRADVIREGDVQWWPALDLTRITIGGLVFLLVVRSVDKSLEKRR